MNLLLMLILSVAQAGFLRMVSEPHLEIQRENQKLVLKGSFQIINQGNEEAMNVYPELEIDNFHWQGASENLDAGQGASWQIDEPLKNLCFQQGPDCNVALPAKGQFLIRVKKNYSDQNFYPFSVPEALKIPELNQEPMTLQMNLQSRMNSENEFAIGYSVKNISDQNLKVKLRPLLPAEVELLSPAPPVDLAAGAEVTGQFEFRNKKGLPGSQYVAYVTAEWERSGERRASFAFISFEIPKPQPKLNWSDDHFFLFWWSWAVFAGLIGMWFFWIRPLRKLQE